MVGLSRRLRSLPVLAVAATVLAASGCSLSSTPVATTSPGAGAPAGAISPPAAGHPGARPLTTTQDTYDGFSIGVPDGWHVFTIDGSVVVSRDATGTEESVVHPGLITAGVTPAALFGRLLDQLQTQVVAAGGQMTHVITSTGNQTPAATLKLSSGSTSMDGRAHLAVLSQKTAHASSVGALVAAWAPSDRFAAESPTLAAIGDTYIPQRATLYQVVRDAAFTYPIPAGWTVGSESQDSIVIQLGDTASAGFLLAATSDPSVTSARGLLTAFMNLAGIHIDQELTTVRLPDQQTATGAVESVLYVEFTGRKSDNSAIHGLVYVLCDAGNVAGTNLATGVVRLGQSKAAQWNALNGAVIHMMGAIQHDLTLDIKQWEHLEQQWQSFDKQEQAFDAMIRGVDIATDPQTGQTYEAPYSAWDPNGPDGPGYYTSDGHKLDVTG